ncbi:unnamed protein product [Prunus armeniaca]
MLPTQPGQIILSATNEWIKASCAVGFKMDKVKISIVWEPPCAHEFKINVDGVICNGRDEWIDGFSVNLGYGHILDAELWGLYFGVKYAIDKGISQLIVEMDANVVVQPIQQVHDPTCHPLGTLVSSCCDLMKRFDSCAIHHIYRENNRVAYGLANWSYNLELGIFFFDVAPIWISSLLLDDMLGVASTRLVCVVSV